MKTNTKLISINIQLTRHRGIREGVESEEKGLQLTLLGLLVVMVYSHECMHSLMVVASIL